MTTDSIDLDRHWNVTTALEQIEKCSFECQAGPLENNIAYRWLKKALTDVGPRYLPGQGVYFEVTADVGGVKLGKWSHFYVVGVHMDSDTERRFWRYTLSSDPPAPWHYGTVSFRSVHENELRLDVPTDPAPPTKPGEEG